MCSPLTAAWSRITAAVGAVAPEAVVAGMDFLAGFRDAAGVVVAPDDGSAGFLPEIEGIDAEDRGALLEWLRRPAPAELGVES